MLDTNARPAGNQSEPFHPGMPNAARRLADRSPHPTRKFTVYAAIVVAMVAILLAGCQPKDAPTPTAATATGLAPNGGATNTDVIPQVKANVLMFYEKSAQDWIADAVKEVNDASKAGGGEIFTQYQGSRKAKQAILYTKYQKDSRDAPVIWNPADAYWFEKLNQDWKDPKLVNKAGTHTGDIVDKGDIILNSRLVLVMWKDRAEVFQKASQSPTYKNKTWTLLRDIATKGWGDPAIGGAAAAGWGKLKLAQTNPLESNSGQATLALLFGEYQQGKPTGKPDDAAFVSWMKDVEGAVQGGFADTTSNALKAMLDGGDKKFDAAICYEQNVLAQADTGESRVRLIYPAPTLAVNFPVSVLKSEWVSTQQFQDARAFINYLLSPKVQTRAVRYGFRPGVGSVQSTVADQLNTPARTSIGFQMDPPVVDKTLDSKNIDGLLFLWGKQYGGVK